MTPTHVAQLTDALVALFDPVVQAIEDTDSAEALLKDMGYQAPSGINFLNDFSPLLGALMDLADQSDDLLRSDTDPDYLALFRSLIDAIQDIIKLIRDIGTTLQTNFPADFLAATDMVAQFPAQLADYLLVRMIERQYPVLHSSLLLIGIIDEGEVTTAATPFNTSYTKRVIRWEKLSDYLSTPLRSMQEAYGWNTNNFDYNSLIGNIHRFGQSIRFFSSPANPDPDTLQALNGGTDVVTDDNADKLWILKFPLLPVLDSPIGAEIYPVLNTTKDKVAGLGLGLYFDPSGGLNFPITDELSLGVKYVGTGPLDAGVLVLPGQPLQLASNIFGESGPKADLSTFIPEFTYTNADQKTLLFDSSFGAKLEFASWALRAGVFAGLGGLYIETDIKEADFTISADQGDGFLQEVLPAQPMTINFDLTVGFSSKTGLYFGGRLGLEVNLPTHISIGTIAVEGITVALKPTDGKIQLTLSANISASLGPLDIVVQNMGAAVTLSFPANRDGNLGPMQVNIGFKPPNGLGLAIDASVVVGGGSLNFDPQKEEYSGMLELQIAEKIGVKGIGLLTTQLPDNAKGYSLVIIIFVEGFTPIQLGFGFTLTSIGGLLAINRTFNEDALRTGLKNHALDNLMFPKDPIRNAPQIISNLNKFFPPANGHHLFGPMAQIGWGTPTLITANVGVILELGARLRLLIMAQIVAILPNPENDLVRLQMDAIGVIDFDQGTASLDATLYDSRLLQYVLTGDMAMRVRWDSSPNLALAVGGLHPAFNPPPNFPKLDRIAINLSTGDNPRLRCEAYFAVTSNTLQFGARAELYAKAAGFSIQGEIGYDVLIQRDPFHFVADFYAQMQLKRGSSNLFKISVEGELAGPRPLHIKGKATFEILWCDFSIRIDKTLVEGELPPLPAGVDVLPRLKEALANPGNWKGQLPDGQRPMVTLRPRLASATEVLLHPLGTLIVKQNVVPLNMDISRFGAAAPAGERHFTINSVSLGDKNQDNPPSVKEFFARAQFVEMSDDEKLSIPSFEPMAAGVSIGSNDTLFTSDEHDWLEVNAIEFETWIVEKDKEPRPSPPEDQEGQKNLYRLAPELLDKQARFGAAANCDVRSTGKGKYRTTMDKYRIAKEGWDIVSTDDLSKLSVPGIEAGKPATYSEALQALHKMKQENPAQAGSFKIIRPSELL